MSSFIDYAISHARLTIVTLLFLLGAGFVAYVTIPKEAEPDVRIPIVYVQLTQRGISPEDSERLLLRPVETQLKSVSNVKEMRSTAYEGGGSVLLEFEAGFEFEVRAGGCARQGRPGQARSAEGCRRAERAGGQPVALSGAGRRPVRPSAGADHASDCPHRQECRRAGSRRAGGGVARLSRRGGGDHRRSDAVEGLQSSARPTHRRLQRIQQPDRGGRPGGLDRPLRREGAEPDRASAGRLEDSDGGLQRSRRHRRRRRDHQADLQGCDVGHARQRHARDDDRGVQAHRRQPDRDRGRREEGDRTPAGDVAGGRSGDLHPGQVEGHPPDAVRSAELGHHRRAAGRGHYPIRVGIPGIAVHRHRYSRLVSGGRAGPATRRPDGQHRGAVLAHPRRRHAGRRRDHRFGVRGAAHGGRHAAEGGLFARRQAHGRPGDRRHGDARGGILTAAVLAGRGRRVHEIPADHARSRRSRHRLRWRFSSRRHLAPCSARLRPSRTTSAPARTAFTCAWSG